jgi:LacI family transcriptional regulator
MTDTSPSKYLVVAAAIEAQLREGKWDGGRLPSVRSVGQKHGVSAVTASRALQVLRDKGLINTVERSGCFRVPPPDAERWAVVLRLTPGPLQRATVGMTRAGFETLSKKQPMHLHFDAFDVVHGLTPVQAEKAAKRAKESGVRGVVLLPSRVSVEHAAADATFLAGCRAAGLPVCLVERDLRGHAGPPETDLVALDDVAGAAELTRHLVGLGRKRVAFVTASPVSSHHDRIAGYLFALHQMRTGRNPLPELLVRQPTDLPGPEAYAAVTDEVVKLKADGVVCYSDYTALGLTLELIALGHKVPRDVAVAGFDNLPIGEMFALGLTSYDYPAEGFAAQAIRLLRDRITDPKRSPVKVVVPGKLIVRGSTAGPNV